MLYLPAHDFLCSSTCQQKTALGAGMGFLFIILYCVLLSVCLNRLLPCFWFHPRLSSGILRLESETWRMDGNGGSRHGWDVARVEWDRMGRS